MARQAFTMIQFIRGGPEGGPRAGGESFRLKGVALPSLVND